MNVTISIAPRPAGGRVCKVMLCALLLTWPVTAHADDWRQWRGANRDGVWNESGILETFPPGGLKVRWRAPVGIGFSSPIVADGRAFVTDSVLDKPKASERVHAFDAMTGEHHWTYAYDVTYPDGAFQEKYQRGPIATPVAADGRVYALGAAGNVVCLEAAKGDRLWQKDLNMEYPGSDIYPSPSPLIEGDILVLLVGAKPAASVIGLNKNTGETVWKALDDGPSASSPIVVTAAGVRQLIVWTDRAVTALAPATGGILWRQPLKTTKDADVSTPVCVGEHLLIGGLMMELDQTKPAAKVLWPSLETSARRVFSDTSTALLQGDFIYTLKFMGNFICVDAKTGTQLWETDQASGTKNGASIHPTVNGDSVLLYNDHGELIRARLTPDGYHEISRALVLEPTENFNRKVAWAAPAYSNRNIYARTDKELVCASLAEVE